VHFKIKNSSSSLAYYSAGVVAVNLKIVGLAPDWANFCPLGDCLLWAVF
jgi:hypothetical protein